ncbi:unnamed protein product [Gordionus sp. m RMFG-2023]|uniref:zinc finger protein 253-like n=1 Tax=Gordionus sp. m RMFG-2023 TaxID=3053472 RepID=UPI0030E3ED94
MNASNQIPLPLPAEIIQENHSYGTSTSSSLTIKSEFNRNSRRWTTTDHNFNITTLDRAAEKAGNDDSGNGRIKVIACQVCGKQFAYTRSLKRHLKCHSLLKSYLCTYCCKGFNVKFDLKRHTRIHTGVKPYKCQMCDKSFTQRCSLESHNRKLHGLQMKYGYKERREKLYVCEECGFTSNRLDRRMEHLNKFCVKRQEKPLLNTNDNNLITEKTENKDNVLSQNLVEKEENFDKTDNFFPRKALSMKSVPIKEEPRQPFSGSSHDFTNGGSHMEPLHCYHGLAKRYSKNDNDNNVCSPCEDSNYSTFSELSAISLETTSREKKINKNEIRHILKKPVENRNFYSDKPSGNTIYPYNFSKLPQTYDDCSNSLEAFIMRCQRALMPYYCNPNNLNFKEVESMRELEAISLIYYFYYANGFPNQSTYNRNLPPTLPPLMHSHIKDH